jgi:hypothetical protein
MRYLAGFYSREMTSFSYGGDGYNDCKGGCNGRDGHSGGYSCNMDAASSGNDGRDCSGRGRRSNCSGANAGTGASSGASHDSDDGGDDDEYSGANCSSCGSYSYSGSGTGGGGKGCVASRGAEGAGGKKEGTIEFFISRDKVLFLPQDSYCFEVIMLCMYCIATP